jgi:hypothetical protein
MRPSYRQRGPRKTPSQTALEVVDFRLDLKEHHMGRVRFLFRDKAYTALLLLGYRPFTTVVY